METLKIFKTEIMDAFETELETPEANYTIKQAYLANCVAIGVQFDYKGVEIFTKGIHAIFDSVINVMDHDLVGKEVSTGAFWAGLYLCLASIYDESMNAIVSDKEYEEDAKPDLMIFNSTVYTAYLLIMNRVYEHLELLDPVHIAVSYINDVDEEEYHDI